MGQSADGIDEIRRRLMGHLSANENITELSREFGALQSNFERVDYALKLLISSDFKLQFIADQKDNATASKLKDQGNSMYKSKKLKEAWELYTKCIRCAEEKSPLLGMAYANRSAVLFELKQYSSCLMDIERALENNYPGNLKSKLLIRRQKVMDCADKCLSNSGNVTPAVDQPNSVISCASDCVKIEESEEFGRFIVAARDIRAGEILAIEKPFASILVNEKLSHCHECLTLCYNLIPCEGCTQAMYCSTSCREKSLNSYHKFECAILKTLSILEVTKLQLLALKLAILIKNRYNEINSSDEGEKCYRSDRYWEIHKLVANTDKRSVSDLFERAVNSAILLCLVEKHTTFFDGSAPDEQQNFKDILMLHMQTGPSNFHEITELAQNSEGVFEPSEIGSGAFAFLSLFNHSCNPNVSRFSYGSTVVLRAIKSLKIGEQCFDNYGYHFAVMDRNERRKHLKRQYYFECVCTACENGWPLYDNLLAGSNATGIDESEIRKLSQGDAKVASAITKKILDKIDSFSGDQHCKDFCDLQEIIKQCFVVFGNKRHLF